MIPAEREGELCDRFRVSSWDRESREYEKAAHRRTPFRATIKDLVTQDVPFTAEVAKRSLKDLKRIRRVKVYNMDIALRNYKGGLLIDFSRAMTSPHYLFVTKPPFRIVRFKHDDLASWQTMIRDEGIPTWERATRNSEYCKKLRSSDSHSSDSENTGEG